jgi:hypothetical protein
MADMSPAEALMAARSAGIHISVDGDDLVLESAAEPPLAVVNLLTEHKAGILTLLRSGIGSAYSDIAGSAASEIIGSAAGDITGSAPIIAAADTTALGRSQGDEWSTTDWRAFFDERVGMAEFDGGLPRPAAEVRAFDCCVAEWLYRTAVISAPGPCPICDDADRPNDPLLPIGIVGGRVWLHIGCVKAWCTARKAEAVAALASMGIKSPGGNSR